MTQMVPAAGLFGSRDARNLNRGLSRLDGHGRLAIAHINQEADLQAERVSALTYVGKRAMQEVTMLSQLEVQLSALVPSATPRLQGIGDLTALATADLVSETIRRLK